MSAYTKGLQYGIEVGLHGEVYFEIKTMPRAILKLVALNIGGKNNFFQRTRVSETERDLVVGGIECHSELVQCGAVYDVGKAEFLHVWDSSL